LNVSDPKIIQVNADLRKTYHFWRKLSVYDA